MAGGDDWVYYAYKPSYALAIAASAVFGVVFLAHLFLMIRHKAWYMWPFTVGVAGECIGYALRRISAEHPRGRSQGLIWYITQELFIILAPACMAASHYMCFGRLISYVGEKYSPVRARRVTAIFVFFDVTSFCIQGAGGSLYSSSNRSIFPTAKAILTVGFLIQIISFGIFAIFAILYQVRARRAGELEGKWTVCFSHIAQLSPRFTGTALILIRGIYRTISFATGTGNSNGYLLSREAWYYGLETIPILLCTLLFLASYPARYIPSDRSLRLHPEEVSSETGTDEEKSAGEDTRRRRWYGLKR
ncbi:BQ5605_C048g12360 [Microbotryum silenes-dioicae]|uniref:BQ5605_C048g12360 protein n=1 Tax=Microbotryum silenes-dioicae TaxID=796604 RepID=A0A2X0MSW2_9BASI|nr:BQ5605_C048g12360 [Microbotryum silenes-dioicae]